VAQRFEWDPVKAASNIRKHGIAFDVAALVFSDPLVVIDQDRVENGEYRWRAVGVVRMTLLVVVHTERTDNDEEIIRIISARRADPGERKRYEQDG